MVFISCIHSTDNPYFGMILYFHEPTGPMSLEKKTWEPTTKTQELSKFLYRAPEPILVVPFILVFSLLSGLLIQFGLEGLTYGFFLVALPAFLSAWTSTPFVEAFGGKFYYRRSFLTSFIGVLILGAVLFVGILIRPVLDVNWRFLLIYGYSLVLSMRYLVIRSTCLNYNRYSFIISSAQTFFAFALHFLLSFNDLGYLEENNFLALQESLFGILTSLCIFLSSLLFIEIVNAPMKTDVGIDGTDLLGFFLSYMIEGTKEIETLFIPLQESFNIPFSIMAVKKRNQNLSSGKNGEAEGGRVAVGGDGRGVGGAGGGGIGGGPNAAGEEGNRGEGVGAGNGGGNIGDASQVTSGEKAYVNVDVSEKPFHALIISPSVHPGPVGTIGGGDLPTKLAEPLKDLADHILVPHGAATNDNNPSTTEECDKVVRAVRALATSLQDEDFTDTSSEILSRRDNTSIHLIRFGNRVLIISEPIPYPSDDIALEMFKTFSWATKYHGFEDLMVIDAHNNSIHGGSPVHVGDMISIEMESMVNELSQEKVDMDSFSMGFGSAIPKNEIDGIGPKGVEVMVMRSHGKTKAFVLFDGNNMIGEVRKDLTTEAEKLVDLSFIFTADNHVVNATLGGFNPVGADGGSRELIPLVRDSINMALEDLEESSVAIRSGFIEGINILGFGNTNRLVATINSTIAILKRAAIPCTLLAITTSALLYWAV